MIHSTREGTQSGGSCRLAVGCRCSGACIPRRNARESLYEGTQARPDQTPPGFQSLTCHSGLTGLLTSLGASVGNQSPLGPSAPLSRLPGVAASLHPNPRLLLRRCFTESLELYYCCHHIAVLLIAPQLQHSSQGYCLSITLLSLSVRAGSVLHLYKHPHPSVAIQIQSAAQIPKRGNSNSRPNPKRQKFHTRSRHCAALQVTNR